MSRLVRFLMIIGLACGAVMSTQARASDSDLDKLRKQVEALQAQVEALEAQVKVLQARMTVAPAPAGAPASPALAAAPPSSGTGTPQSEAYEAEAKAIIDDIVRLTDQGEADKAREKIVDLRTKYGASKWGGQATYFSHELEVIGKSVPADWGIEKWIQGKDSIDLSGKPTTVVVFWEEWCPHCKAEMPKLQQLYAAHKAQGLQVFGITKVTQTSTDEKVRAYLDQNGIQFPVAKETGSPSDYFNVKGIPAAAIVKGGKIVWRGHPIRLTDDIVKRWLQPS